MIVLFLLFLFSFSFANEYIVKLKDENCILNAKVKRQINNSIFIIDIEPVELNNLPLTCIEAIEENKKIKQQENNIGWAVDSVNAYISFQPNSYIVAVMDSGLNESDIYQIIEPYNAIDDSSNVSDNTGHGTGVSKVIASVLYNPQIIPCKFIEKDSGNLFDEIICYEYIIKKKQEGYNIAVINASFSSKSDSYLVREEIRKLKENGIMLVASAGNDGNNLDETKNSYPCLYTNEFENVICVGASTKENNLFDFSNYGRNSVDLTAPGYAFRMYGTSMSAPFVSASVVMTREMNTNKDLKEIKQIITSSVNPSIYLENRTKSGGTLDLMKLYKISFFSIYTYLKVITDTTITSQFGNCNENECSFKVLLYSSVKLNAYEPVEWEGDCKHCGISDSCIIEVDKEIVCYANSLKENQIVYKSGGCSFGSTTSNSFTWIIFILFARYIINRRKKC